MVKFLIPFIIAFLLTVVLTVFFNWMGKRIHWRKRKSARHIHKKNTLRIGGLAMASAFNLAVFLNKDLFMTPEIYGIVLGSLAVMIFGFWDDIKEVFWKIQLFIQVSVSIFVFIVGLRIYYVTNPLTGGIISLDSGISVILSVILVIFWIILVMNAVNWLDGIDGLSGGVVFIAALTVFFLSLKPEVHQPPVAILAAILMGSILGFLIFNFNPAKVLAGTSGSMFMGFVLAVLAIIAGTKIATALLVLAIPVLDLVWVIKERYLAGKSIFAPDRNHLHYRLMELGWTQRKITFWYWFASVLIAIVALNTRYTGKAITLVLATVIMAAVFVTIDRKIKNKNAQSIR